MVSIEKKRIKITKTNIMMSAIKDDIIEMLVNCRRCIIETNNEIKRDPQCCQFRKQPLVIVFIHYWCSVPKSIIQRIIWSDDKYILFCLPDLYRTKPVPVRLYKVNCAVLL